MARDYDGQARVFAMIISIAGCWETFRDNGVEMPVRTSIASTKFLLLPATGKKAEASKNS